MKLFSHGGACGDSCCLRVQNMSVVIGGDKILKDVNLHVHCGQMVALIGPNGAGKSTFLKAVLGQREYEGVIAFSSPGERSRKPRIGYVPQSPTFDPSDPVSVSDLFACCLSKRPAFLGQSKALREQILECLDMVHGTDLIDKRVGTLSGGELQRVLLALALEPLPNILILDEPLSGVDVEGMQSLMDMLDEIRKTYDLSILMTTHDFSMLPRYADQVVLINHGIAAKGTPEEVLNSEDTEYLASFAGKLCQSADDLYAYLERMEQVDEKAGLLGSYCMRQRDVDTRVAKYQAMTGKFMSMAVAMGAACSFETPEILSIPDDVLDGFYAAQPKLERYRRYLTNMRRRKAHTLSPAEEKLLASAGEMSHAPSDIFGQFENADLTFPNAVDANGNEHPMSNGTFVLHETSEDRVLRKSAYENMYHTLANFKNTTAALLNAQGKQLKFFADARKYPSTLEAALDRTNVPTSVYLNLIEAVHQNMDKMHRYVRLRKKLLGVDELHFYDVYTSLIAGADRKIPFNEAKQTVYDALYPLGEDYRAILKEGFENRWIDVYENEGKRSGAYSAGAAVHPYVLLNYTGTLDSTFTLAHEMGHALHSYLSNKYQNPIDSDYVIFVAEVASTCNEALLMEYLLGKTTDKKERAYLINHFLEQFKGTLYRQTMFAEFELIIGRMIGEGKTLTAEVLCEEYKKLNELYFGPDMVVDDEIAMEWARIPHFYYNYYVFQYATGYSAAIALSRKILAEGESAVKDYLGFLSGGCSKSPIDLLKGAGVDMTSPEPVNQALQLFGELLDEMEELTKDL